MDLSQNYIQLISEITRTKLKMHLSKLRMSAEKEPSAGIEYQDLA